MLWDLILLLVVTTMVVTMSYLHSPLWKAVVLSLPIPFTVTYLSLGIPVDAPNVAGLFILLLYTYAVRFLHRVLRWHIVLSIGVSALLYIVIGGFSAAIIPKTETSFLVSVLLALGVGIFLLVFVKDPYEPGHRTLLPIYLKIPLTLVMVGLLLSGKSFLQGTMTLFPMVGVFGAYESRLSLATNCRQIHRLMVAMIPLLCVLHYAQSFFGNALALAVGWILYISIMWPLMIGVFRASAKRMLDPVLPT
jgi:hypothetical protein